MASAKRRQFCLHVIVPYPFSRYLELQGKLQTDIELIRKKRGDVITERVRYSQSHSENGHFSEWYQRGHGISQGVKYTQW